MSAEEMTSKIEFKKGQSVSFTVGTTYHMRCDDGSKRALSNQEYLDRIWENGRSPDISSVYKTEHKTTGKVIDSYFDCIEVDCDVAIVKVPKHLIGVDNNV